VGDYFDVADHVIQMINYRPVDVTSKAHTIANMSPAKRDPEDDASPFSIHARIPVPESIVPLNEHGKFSVYAKGLHRVNFGKSVIDLTDVEQLIELSQTKVLGYALEYAKQYMDKNTLLSDVVQRVMLDIEEHGIDVISEKISGHFAWFRELELAFALNRLRGFDVLPKDHNTN
jgi:predicted ABC-class ATPase